MCARLSPLFSPGPTGERGEALPVAMASQPRAWLAPKSRGHRPGLGRGPAPSEGDFNRAWGTDPAGNWGPDRWADVWVGNQVWLDLG